MRRLRRLIVPLALVAALVVIVGVVEESAADLENGVFTSRSDRLRLIVPRGWQPSDQPSYPGLLLWMSREQSSILLTGEPFTRAMFCSWPVACRATPTEAQSANYACALRQKLMAQQLRVGPTQPGPKETGAAGLPSVWFEYDDGKHFLRQAIAISSSNRAFSLILSAPTSDLRATHTRVFEQVLRTLQLLGPEDAARNEVVGAGIPGDAAPGDAAPGNAATGDAGPGVAAPASRAPSEPPPTPAPDPVGPCTP